MTFSPEGKTIIQHLLRGKGGDVLIAELKQLKPDRTTLLAGQSMTEAMALQGAKAEMLDQLSTYLEKLARGEPEQDTGNPWVHDAKYMPKEPTEPTTTNA